MEPLTRVPLHHQQQQQESPLAYQVVRVATAVTAGGSFLLLSGLLLVGTVIALACATPILVLFSPVLVPAVLAVVLLTGGFVTSSGFGFAAVALLKWMYDYVKGYHPTGADQIDHARHKLASKAKDIKEFGQQQIGGAGGGHHNSA
ncbi:Oleosin [Thalictrum thalictroides]|uniref:Oleosin n=1 Tax=Thalictrum thalictroides TaxID=46969 RepID=A0A7J6W0J0_THATH|nr:Oleosin [Thalictrum thalictroides]